MFYPKFRLVYWISCIILVLLCFSQTSWAYQQNPGLNWGNTNILDGMIPPPGVWLSSYVVGYSADEFKNGDGHDLPGDHEIDVLAYAPQFYYIHDQKILDNFTVGFQFFPTIIQDFNLDSDFLTADNSMLGDLIFGPFIGRTEQLGKNWLFHWVFEYDTFFPTGEYDEDDDINPGANYWTFEPWFNFTLQMPHGFALSTRQHFTYNTENHDTDIQAGCLYHFNYSLTKSLDFIDPNLRLGVVGYYGKQLENDELEGHDIHNSKEQIFAIGPGISWRTPTGIIFSLKAYFENQAENRTEGEKVVFRMIQKLW